MNHYLSRLFEPKNIALFGATERYGTVGRILSENLLTSQSHDSLFFFNPKYSEIFRHPCFSDIKSISAPIDLAIITTPAATVPDVLEDCGLKKIPFAVVISSGFERTLEAINKYEFQILEVAKKYNIRILGPNCLGFVRNTNVKLNATFFKGLVHSGNLALISQSGAVCTSILDWAISRKLGFSSVVSLGDASDLDFGEFLDYFSTDFETRVILLYIEGVRNPKAFMSSLRQASRIKPVIVLKVGRSEKGKGAARSHTGSLSGSDQAFETALERAGAIRVNTIKQLFIAAEVLSRYTHQRAERVTVLTNGGGLGVLCADATDDHAVILSQLGDELKKELQELLPQYWSNSNPIDILGDASPTRYRESVQACLKDKNTDALMVMYAPQAISEPTEIAKEIVILAKNVKKPILTCWMGESSVLEARSLFLDAGIPTFESPEDAVQAISFMNSFHEHQTLLLQAPDPFSDRKEADVDGARMIIGEAVSAGKVYLDPVSSKAILNAFRIPVTQGTLCQTPQEALIVAEQLGFPVVLKIDASEITHKTDVNGVVLNIKGAEELRGEFHRLKDRFLHSEPALGLRGIMVEKMIEPLHHREVMVGVSNDSTMGRVISFGIGGIWVEVLKDMALSLPPLNEKIINHWISKTKANQFLDSIRGWPAVDRKKLSDLLLRVSDMVCEFPEITEIDFNPVMVNEKGAIVVDHRIVLSQQTIFPGEYRHLVISPYPSNLQRHIQLSDGIKVHIRPIRPEDARIESEFVEGLSSQARYFRFMGTVQKLTQEMLIRFTQIDYDREMALIATTSISDTEVEIAVGRYAANPDGESCEFALVVDDKWQNKGIGTEIMRDLIKVARKKGFRKMNGEILKDNGKMVQFIKHLGFITKTDQNDPGLVWVEINLI